jgi:hypothetical protein
MAGTTIALKNRVTLYLIRMSPTNHRAIRRVKRKLWQGDSYSTLSWPGLTRPPINQTNDSMMGGRLKGGHDKLG